MLGYLRPNRYTISSVIFLSTGFVVLKSQEKHEKYEHRYEPTYVYIQEKYVQRYEYEPAYFYDLEKEEEEEEYERGD